MRILGWALFWAVAGLILGYAATLAIGLAAFEIFQVSQREGAAAMGLAFFIAPAGACLAAIVGAIAAAMITSRRERARQGVEVSPRPPLGRGARIIIGVLVGLVAGYGAAIGLLGLFYALQGSNTFASYGWAFAAVWTPKVMALAGATLGGLLANPNA
jgi:hypothetical protein